MKTKMMLSVSLVTPLILICFFNCGCTQYWYQEGKTFDQCMLDRNSCFAELQKRSDFGDVSTDYEQKFMENCMTNKGYRIVKDDELPLDAKRQTPDTSLYWKMKGVAGIAKEP